MFFYVFFSFFFFFVLVAAVLSEVVKKDVYCKQKYRIQSIVTSTVAALTAAPLLPCNMLARADYKMERGLKPLKSFEQ